MQPVNQTDYVLADNEAPEILTYIMYDLLTDENKKIVNRLIEQLKVEQSGCR